MTEVLVGPPSAPTQDRPAGHPLAPLHDPGTMRRRCAAVLHAVEQNVSPSFKLNRAALGAVAERVASLTLRDHPTLVIPCHSHWHHFDSGGVSRMAELERRLAGRSAADAARAHFDLAVVSVLMDVSAGVTWRYRESTPLSAAALPQAAPEDLLALLDRAASARPGEPVAPDAPAANDAPAPCHAGSAGLAVACFRAFMAGAFSATPGDPCRADAAALRHVDAAALRAIFQSSPSNPLAGLEGRAAALARLGGALQLEAAADSARGHPAAARPALLFDRISAYGQRQAISAAEVLGEVLRVLTPIWPSGSKVQGLPAGDVWPHLWAGAEVGRGGQHRTTEGWVPLHTGGQWLTCTLLAPLQAAGISVGALHDLTGLADCRSAGLLIDGGVIVPRDPRLLTRTWKLQDECIIELRALTLALLDELAALVQARLGKTAQELPLACRLQACIRASGRELARELRSDTAAPLRFEHDAAAP